KAIQDKQSRKYRCGFCGESIASDKGFPTIEKNTSTGADYETTSTSIYVCHYCHRPTFFGGSKVQVPGPLIADAVGNVTDGSVSAMYEEARRAFGASAYTASVLCCRKLLMHIAVAKGANQGESFVKYVAYLASANYFPPDANVWVDQIRAKGNEANHEIRTASKEEAEDLVLFCEMLLKVIFEFPARAQSRTVVSAAPVVIPHTPRERL
ncbi:MAG: DUF4145 domain-containing protein, partial [FCB group bacterium]|nr:DUF4145 domain-containing protein [FCB group bacterium]